MAQPFLDRRPSRQFGSPIIEGRDLARMIGIPEADLREFGVRTQLPFANCAGLLWIKERDLPAWRRAANAYRGG
jgi:hypothetical protein